MARPRTSDLLGQHNFWLADIDPNFNPPFFVFSPTLGFSQVSGLEIEMQTEEYHPLSDPYPVHLPGKGRVAPITLSRGVRFTDSDFYRWIDRAIRGVDDFRRNLLLIHYMGAGVTAVQAAQAALDVIGVAPKLDEGPPAVLRAPGRVFILWDCIPVRYRAGDLDASSGDITIMELEIQPRVVTEAALGAAI